jgi:hypothetical protein
MSDFFSPDNEEEQISRFDELSKSKSKRWSAATILAIATTLFVVVVVFGGAYFLIYPSLKSAIEKSNLQGDKTSSLTTEASSTVDASKSSSEDKVDLNPLSNVLVVGVENVGDKQIARGLLVGRIDLDNRTVQSVNIPERTYFNIEGLGLDQINKVYTMGMSATKATIEKLIQVPIDGYVVLDYDDFQFLVSENRFRIAFSKAIEMSYSKGERKEILKVLNAMDTANSNIMPLPVQYISVNGEPFFEPDNVALSKLLDSLWGVKIEIKDKPVRVMILNGNGLPGIGKSMSDILSASGYVVADIKNASSFDIKTTSIIAYKESLVDKAKAIKEIIEAGNVVVDTTGASSDVVEIVVIIGHDYKPVAKPATSTTTADDSKATSASGSVDSAVTVKATATTATTATTVKKTGR